MTKKAVLAIGLEPAHADFSGSPGLSPDLVRTYVATQLDVLRARGYEVEICLLEPDESPEETVKRVLAARRFDCVMIGAGLRQPASQFLLFERVVNLVHSFAPKATICFNTKPADTLDAVQRWVPKP